MAYETEALFAVSLVVVAILVAWWQQHAFIVRLKHGSPHLVKGKVTPAFLAELTDSCREAGLHRGWVGGLRRGKRIVLVFSWHFPTGLRQRLRNLWALHA